MSEKIYDNLIVDVYNIFYRWSFFEKSEQIVMIDGVKVHTEGLIQFFKAMDTYTKKFSKDEKTKVFLCFDNATSLQERQSVYEEYKNNRKKMPDWFYKELDYIELICRYYSDNWYVLRAPKMEADDYVSNILRYWVSNGDKTLMISEDEDWCRYLSSDVNQYMKHEIWDDLIFEKNKGYKPTSSNIMFAKALYGEESNSDNIIPAIPTYPKMYFEDLINNYTNMKDFIRDVKIGKLDYLDLGWKKKIEDVESLLLTNEILINGIEISDEELLSYTHKSKFKENKLRIIYSVLNIFGKIDDRIKPITKEVSLLDMLNGEDLKRI